MTVPSELLAPQLEEFYEKGLMNIINVIPRNLESSERIIIEGVVYTAYGFFRSYSVLENILSDLTQNGADITQISPSINRDIFTLYWQCVDAAHNIGQLLRTRQSRKFVLISEELYTILHTTSKFRNYINHLKDNLDNISKAKEWLPMFGWGTFQFSPYHKDATGSPNETFLINIGSTHFEDKVTIKSQDHIKGSVFSYIDNIKLHIRRDDSINLSDLLISMSINLSEFSFAVQSYLVEKIEKYSGDTGGVRKGWIIFSVKADMKVRVDTSTLESMDDPKMRITFEEALKGN